MIVVKISGGLGNQMFQYAFGRQLQEMYHMPLVLETFRYDDVFSGKLGSRLFPIHTEQRRNLLLQRFCIPFTDHAKEANSCRMPTGAENALLLAASMVKKAWAEKALKIPQTGPKGYAQMSRRGFYSTRDLISFYPFEKTAAKHIFASGWFQSEKYFHDVTPAIRKELRVREVSSDTVRLLADRMNHENSVCVHIRRGDYIGHPCFDVCTEAYYRRAVALIRERVEKPVLYVFSNSPMELDWIRANYAFLEDAHFVKEGKDELDDLYLMYHCRHHVISNSTFSWWGSYMKLQDGLTVCPDRWINEEMQQDILLDDWIRLPV